MASTQTIEELEASLQELEISTEYIDALNKLGQERTRKNVDLDRAFDVITQAQALCEDQFPEYRKGLAEALINLAKYYQQRVDLEKSLRYIMQAGEICKELDDVDLTFLHNQALFIVYQFSVDWNQALEVSIDSLRLAQAHRRTDIEAKALVSVAKMYTRLGEYAPATAYYERALVMATALDDEYMGTIINLNVTYPYRCLGNYEQALHHASLAYDQLRGKMTENEGVVLGIYGHIYTEMAQHDRAMDYHQRKLKIADALDSNYLRAFTYSDIGAVHVAMGQITEGIQWLESGIQLAESQQLTEALVPFYGPLVQAYKANQDYEKALTTFEKLAALRAESQSTTALNQRNTLLVIHETKQAKLEAQLHQERAERLHAEAKHLADQNAFFQKINALKDELVATASHDMRNPLTAMNMELSMLQRLTLDNPKAQRYVNRLQKNVTHVTHLIEDLLDFSDVQSRLRPQMAPTDLTALVNEATIRQESRCRAKQIDLQTDLAPDPVYLQLDAHQFERVLDNLLGNAVKYTGDGG